MESVSLESKQQSQKVDRVVLDVRSIAVIQKISEQIQNELRDLVQLSQKDIVNFLIRKSTKLSEADIIEIKNEHFDIVRALKRATQEAIKAKQDGHEIPMDELLKIIQTPSVNKVDLLRKPRGRRKKADGTSDVISKNDTILADSEHSEAGVNDHPKSAASYSKSENLRSNNQLLAT